MKRTALGSVRKLASLSGRRRSGAEISTPRPNLSDPNGWFICALKVIRNYGNENRHRERQCEVLAILLKRKAVMSRPEGG